MYIRYYHCQNKNQKEEILLKDIILVKDSVNNRQSQQYKKIIENVGTGIFAQTAHCAFIFKKKQWIINKSIQFS